MLTTHSARRPIAVATLAVTTLLGGVACGSGRSGGVGTGEGTQVVASFYPVAWVARQIGGDAAAVTELTRPGTEPHDLELTPRQITDVRAADLVIYVKGVQPAVDQAVEQHAEDHAVDVVGLVKALAVPEAHEAEHAEAAEHAETGTDHGEASPHDPHIWLDPSRLATVATAIGERLAKMDGAHAAAYRHNARTLAGTLTALDGEFRAGLATCSQRKIVTSHDAFGYLADRYDLTQTSIAGLSPENEPSPNRLAALTKEVKASKVDTVFTETLASPKIAETLARETGVRTAVLDPVEGVARGSKDDYLSIMRRNLQALRTALKCS